MTSVSFDVAIIDDNTFEVNEKFILTISNKALPDNVILGSPPKSKVTIWDDDRKQLYCDMKSTIYVCALATMIYRVL